MKIFGAILLTVMIGLGLFGIYSTIYAGYEWENNVLSNWSLADKASTLDAKAGYIDKFIVALQSNNLADNDALIFKTADNNCQNNIDAVSTLKKRLDEIKGMDVGSFQYQQAIQQITQQEQGEADKLLATLNGCWMKTHHYILWSPLSDILAVIYVMSIIVGVTLIVE